MSAFDEQRLRRLFAELSKWFFITTGAVIIASAATFLIHSMCLNCTMVYWIVGTPILASWVYPTSVLIIGFFFIIYGLKFGFRGIALMVMVFGAFDVMIKMFALYFQGVIFGMFGTGPQTIGDARDVYFWIQNALMFGGFALAGFPKLKANRWLLIMLATLVASIAVLWPGLIAWHGIYAYQVYEVTLFIYVYKSAELRRLPSWLRI